MRLSALRTLLLLGTTTPKTTPFLQSSLPKPFFHHHHLKMSNTPEWCPEQQIYIDGIVPSHSSFEIDALLEENDGCLKLFGYGSLCWNPGTGTTLSKSGVTTALGRAVGWKRCWAQRSADHRGTPDFLGFVCTLLSDEEVSTLTSTPIPSTPTLTEGVIYTLPPHLVDDCLSELDYREKGGYARDVIRIIQDDTNEEHHALLYRGTPSNPAFWKRALWDLPMAAATMAVSKGPSGPNDEYLYRLDAFLSSASSSIQSGDVDTHSLASLCRTFQKESDLYFLYGSGSNQHGQLLLKERKEDVEELMELVVVVPKAERIPKPIRLAAGGGHSGLLTETGQVYLWGWNEHHQLGRMSASSSYSPYESIQPLSSSISVEKLSLGFAHTLLLENETGHVYAFGDNNRGQCTGSSSSASNEPITTPTLMLEEPCVDISAGVFHSAIITSQGECICLGTSNFVKQFKKWKPKDGSRLIQVKCGRKHTVLLDDKGRVWTVGDNQYQQLGRRTDDGNDDGSPKLVEELSGLKCLDIDCGWSHTVALVQTPDDGEVKLYGWGRNDKGQLGISLADKTKNQSCISKPTCIQIGDIQSVQCGSESTVVLKNDGTFWSCGWNEHGNLGSGDKEDRFEWKKMTGAKICKSPNLDGSGEEENILFAVGGAHFLAMKV